MSMPRPQRCTSRLRHLIASIAASVALIGTASAQTGPVSADDATYLRELIEMDLEEVLEDFLDQVAEEDEVRAAQLRMTAERLRMERSGVTAKRREQHIDAILQIRSALIESNPRHPDRAIWMADQAQGYYDGLFALDGAGVTALFGYPSPRQRAIARNAAAGMYDFASRADVEVGRTILELEADPDFRDDAELQMRRRRLIEEERDGRIAYLRGIGAHLHAELNPERVDDRDRLYRLAAGGLEPLSERLSGGIAARARLYAGLASGRLDEFDASRTLLQAVIDDDEALPVDVFAARMGLVLNRRGRSGTEAALAMLDEVARQYGEAGDLFYRVVVADRQFLLRRRLAEIDDSFSLADAYRAYLDLLETTTGVSGDQLRAIVLARLANATDDRTPLDELPPLVTVARASHLAGEQGAFDQAEALLRRTLESTSLDDPERALVLFELGTVLIGGGDTLQAARRFTEVALAHPQYDRADEAITLAASIAEKLHRQKPADRPAREALQAALDVLLAKYPNLPRIDHWRYAAGRLALAERRYDQAVSLFRQVSSDAERWPDALFMQAAAARAKAMAARDHPDAALALNAAIEAVRDVRPLLRNTRGQQPDEDRRRALAYYLGMLDVFEAEALLGLDRPREALRTLAAIDSGSRPDEQVLAEALRVRINAHQAAGEPDEAQRAVERLIEAAPGQVEPVIAPMLASLQSEVVAMLEADREDEARAHAERVLVPVAESLAGWIDARGGANVELRLRIADAYRLGGRYGEALRLYDDLLGASPSAVQALFGKAESLFALDGEANLAEAMMIFRRLAAAGPGSTDSQRTGYWSAQLRMLQILDRTGRNTDQIVPRIRQLRERDRNLGGLRFRREFERLQNRHS